LVRENSFSCQDAKALWSDIPKGTLEKIHPTRNTSENTKETLNRTILRRSVWSR